MPEIERNSALVQGVPEPVVRNDASRQFQLDVFGEPADLMFQAYKAGMRPTERGRGLRSVILDYLGQRFRGSNHIRRPRQACRTKCG